MEEKKVVYVQRSKNLLVECLQDNETGQGYFLVRDENDVTVTASEIVAGEVRYLTAQRRRDVVAKGSLEYLVAERIKALVEGESELIKVGKLGGYDGEVRYIGYTDLRDAVNAANGFGGKDELKAKTIGEITRECLGLKSERTGSGWMVVLDEKKVSAMCEKFGLSEINSAVTPGHDLIDGNDE